MADHLQSHEDWQQLALEEARGAAVGGDVPVGAIVVYEGEVIGRGQNQIERSYSTCGIIGDT